VPAEAVESDALLGRLFMSHQMLGSFNSNLAIDDICDVLKLKQAGQNSRIILLFLFQGLRQPSDSCAQNDSSVAAQEEPRPITFELNRPGRNISGTAGLWNLCELCVREHRLVWPNATTRHDRRLARPVRQQRACEPRSLPPAAG
jgi:hypothetical protein